MYTGDKSNFILFSIRILLLIGIEKIGTTEKLMKDGITTGHRHVYQSAHSRMNIKSNCDLIKNGAHTSSK